MKEEFKILEQFLDKYYISKEDVENGLYDIEDREEYLKALEALFKLRVRIQP